MKQNFKRIFVIYKQIYIQNHHNRIMENVIINFQD